MIASIIRGIEPQEDDGICSLLHEAFKANNVHFRRSADFSSAVSACLQDGFTYYTPTRGYPIAHPTLKAFTAFITANASRQLWDTSTEYGRRRHAALVFIKERADSFSMDDGILRYSPGGRTAMVRQIIGNLTVTSTAVGLCELVHRSIKTPSVPYSFGGVVRAIKDCLQDGFEHYSGNGSYPIAHPKDDPREAYANAYDKNRLWNKATIYGRRRRAALVHVRQNAHAFYVHDGVLEYNPSTPGDHNAN